MADDIESLKRRVAELEVFPPRKAPTTMAFLIFVAILASLIATASAVRL